MFSLRQPVGRFVQRECNLRVYRPKVLGHLGCRLIHWPDILSISLDNRTSNELGVLELIEWCSREHLIDEELLRSEENGAILFFSIRAMLYRRPTSGFFRWKKTPSNNASFRFQIWIDL